MRTNLLNKETIIFALVGELIFWSPVIVTAILALMIDPWWWTATTSIIVFWAGPFTPAVPLQIALIFGIKKIFTKKPLKKEL